MKDNNTLPNEWELKRLDEIGEVCSGSTPPTGSPECWDGSVVWITPNDLSKLRTPYISDSGRKITAKGLKNIGGNLLPPNSIVISSRAPIGYVAIPQAEFCTNQGCKSIALRDNYSAEFVYYNINFHVDKLKNVGNGTTFTEITKTDLCATRLPFPTEKTEQAQIAAVLSCLDRAIEQTEALIAKQQRLKRGLMQDLLTKGIDAHGNIRSEATHQFKDSPLGRIPQEWEVFTFEQLIESAVDGPFGSNLKTEHYVPSPGVRVIRLQNIGIGYFNDRDKAYVSGSHAQTLKRHEIAPGDLLVASLGDAKYPIARACIYSLDAKPGIVKADCFRIRLKPEMALNDYVMYLLNCPNTRGDINLLGQGVTRDRATLTKLKEIRLYVPPVNEQTEIAQVLNSQTQNLLKAQTELMKLKVTKAGLMQDLLTGRVSVGGLLAEGGAGR